MCELTWGDVTDDAGKRTSSRSTDRPIGRMMAASPDWWTAVTGTVGATGNHVDGRGERVRRLPPASAVYSSSGRPAMGSRPAETSSTVPVTAIAWTSSSETSTSNCTAPA